MRVSDSRIYKTSRAAWWQGRSYKGYQTLGVRCPDCNAAVLVPRVFVTMHRDRRVTSDRPITCGYCSEQFNLSAQW